MSVAIDRSSQTIVESRENLETAYKAFKYVICVSLRSRKLHGLHSDAFLQNKGEVFFHRWPLD